MLLAWPGTGQHVVERNAIESHYTLKGGELESEGCQSQELRAQLPVSTFCGMHLSIISKACSYSINPEPTFALEPDCNLNCKLGSSSEWASHLCYSIDRDLLQEPGFSRTTPGKRNTATRLGHLLHVGEIRNPLAPKSQPALGWTLGCVHDPRFHLFPTPSTICHKRHLAPRQQLSVSR